MRGAGVQHLGAALPREAANAATLSPRRRQAQHDQIDLFMISRARRIAASLGRHRLFRVTEGSAARRSRMQDPSSGLAVDEDFRRAHATRLLSRRNFQVWAVKCKHRRG